MSRTVLRATAACVVIAAMLAAWRLREVLAIVLGATMIATAIEPLAQRLSGRRISRGLALGLSYASVVLLTLATFGVVGRVLLAEMATLGNDLGASYASARARWQSDGFLGSVLADHLPEKLTQMPTELLHGSTWTSTTAPLHVLGSAAWTMVLAICWSYGGERVLTVTLSLVPSRWRARGRATWQAWNEATSAILRTMLAESLLLVVLLLSGYILIGVSYAAAAAVLVVAVRRLPFVGVPAALVVAALAGALVSSWLALVAAGLTAVCLIASGLLLQRHARGAAHPLVVALVTIMILMPLGGAAVILAPIVAGGLQALGVALLATSRMGTRVAAAG